MKRLAIVLCGTAFLAAVGLCVATRVPALGACGPKWVDFVSYPNAVTLDELDFTAPFHVEWRFPTDVDPDLAWIETEAGTLVNINCFGDCDTAISYAPSLWNPSGCENVTYGDATGTKLNTGTARFDAKASVWDGNEGVAADVEEFDIPAN